MYSETKDTMVSISKVTYFKLLGDCLYNLRASRNQVKNELDLTMIGELLENLKVNREQNKNIIIEALCEVCSKAFFDIDGCESGNAVLDVIKELGFIDVRTDKQEVIIRGRYLDDCADISLKKEYAIAEDGDCLHKLMILYISLWKANYEKIIYVLNEINKITEQHTIEDCSPEFYLLKSIFNLFYDDRGYVFCEEIWTKEDLEIFQKFSAVLRRHSLDISDKASSVQNRVHNIFLFAEEHGIEMTECRENNRNNYFEGKKKWLLELSKTKSIDELEQIEKEQRLKDNVPINVWAIKG